MSRATRSRSWPLFSKTQARQGSARILLAEKTNEQNHPVGEWQLEEMLDARSLATIIHGAAVRETQALRESAAYGVFAFHADSLAIVGRYVFRIEVGSGFAPSRNKADEHGIIGMLMGHAEISARLSLGHSREIVDQYQTLFVQQNVHASRQLEQAHARIRVLEEREAAAIETHERLQSQLLERQASIEAAKRNDDRRDEMRRFGLEKLGLLLPLIMAKLGAPVAQMAAGGWRGRRTRRGDEPDRRPHRHPHAVDVGRAGQGHREPPHAGSGGSFHSPLRGIARTQRAEEASRRGGARARRIARRHGAVVATRPEPATSSEGQRVMKSPLDEDLEHLLLPRLAGKPGFAARLAARALRAYARARDRHGIVRPLPRHVHPQRTTHMKHFPKPLISFRKLQGGQFGTLDVQAATPHSVQLSLGSDFIYLTRPQWIALRCAVDRFFHCETETVIVAQQGGRSVIFEEREVEEREEEIEEEEIAPPPPPPPARSRAAGARRRTANG